MASSGPIRIIRNQTEKKSDIWDWRIKLFLSKFQTTSDGVNLSSVYSSLVIMYRFKALHWSISTFCYFMFRLYYIYVTHLHTSYFADSEFSMFKVC